MNAGHDCIDPVAAAVVEVFDENFAVSGWNSGTLMCMMLREVGMLESRCGYCVARVYKGGLMAIVSALHPHSLHKEVLSQKPQRTKPLSQDSQ